MNPPTSKLAASVGRVVLVFSNQFDGPRPAQVVMGPWASPEHIAAGSTQLVNVTVLLDSANDRKLCRQDGGGATVEPVIVPAMTLTSIALHDPLTDEERAAKRAAQGPTYWAEWMPYQKGQAAKTDDLTPRLAAIEAYIGKDNLTNFAKDHPSN